MSTHRSDDLATEASAAIEALLLWSREVLGGLIGLGELTRYLDGDGPLGLVAPRVVRELDRTEAALAELPALLARIRRAAESGSGPA